MDASSVFSELPLMKIPSAITCTSNEHQQYQARHVNLLSTSHETEDVFKTESESDDNKMGRKTCSQSKTYLVTCLQVQDITNDNVSDGNRDVLAFTNDSDSDH